MPDNKEHKADKEISVWQKIEEILKEPSSKNFSLWLPF